MWYPPTPSIVTFSPVLPSFRIGSNGPSLSSAGPAFLHPQPIGTIMAGVMDANFLRKILRVSMIIDFSGNTPCVFKYMSSNLTFISCTSYVNQPPENRASKIGDLKLILLILFVDTDLSVFCNGFAMNYLMNKL
jgi:hypothetical protein